MASRTARRSRPRTLESSATDTDVPASPWRYHSGLDRAIFAVALLGFLVVTHLAVQSAGGFAEGCTGFSDTIAEAPSGCATAFTSAYATFPGTSIPNTILGFWFYGLIVALGLGIAAAGERWLGPLKQARMVFVFGGLIYALYLVYRLFFSLEALCGLCLASHALTATIAVLVFLDHRSR
jgi:uncharacterized membrane protein